MPVGNISRSLWLDLVEVLTAEIEILEIFQPAGRAGSHWALIMSHALLIFLGMCLGLEDLSKMQLFKWNMQIHLGKESS